MNIKKQKKLWGSEKRRIAHVLKSYKDWKQRDADSSKADDFLQRISNIIGVKA